MRRNKKKKKLILFSTDYKPTVIEGEHKERNEEKTIISIYLDKTRWSAWLITSKLYDPSGKQYHRLERAGRKTTAQQSMNIRYFFPAQNGISELNEIKPFAQPNYKNRMLSFKNRVANLVTPKFFISPLKFERTMEKNINAELNRKPIEIK